MITSGRERVVPPFSPRGLWPAALLVGLGYGALLAIVMEDLAEWLVSNWPTAGVVVLVHVVTLPLALIGVAIGRQPIRPPRVLWIAAVFLVGFVLAMMAVSLTKSEGFGIGSNLLAFPLRVALAFGVYWAVTAGLLMLGWVTARRLFGTPVPQTDPPRFCWVCAYERGDIDPCPECGTTAESAAARPQREAAAWRALRRWALPAIAAVAIGFTGYSAWRIAVDTIPSRRFLEAFGEDQGWTSTYAYIDQVYGADRNGLGGRFLNSFGVTRELPDGSGRMILVSYRALVPDGLPVMQVRICAEATLPLGWPPQAQRQTDWGSPGTIVADLDREQAEHVVRHGVPQSLIDAIVAEADRVGWKPWGGMQSGGTRIEIDPALYFADQSDAE